MKSVGLLFANVNYKSGRKLPGCESDLDAMTSLLLATGRFSQIISELDLTADEIRNQLRNTLAPENDYDEVFFYFSGHGSYQNLETYLWGRDFDFSHPNETGIRYDDLLEIFRRSSPRLCVNIIDACSSGAQALKGQSAFQTNSAERINNFVQFSSCLPDQDSMGTKGLSTFTEAFLEACVKKPSGPVFYSDVKNLIRDKFLANNDQTPFFVEQGTGREIVVDDASKLDEVRKKLAALGVKNDVRSAPTTISTITQTETAPSLEELFSSAEKSIGSSEISRAYVSDFFDMLVERFQSVDLQNLYEGSHKEFPYYDDEISTNYVGRILSRERRPDNFVLVSKDGSSVASSSANSLLSLSLALTNSLQSGEHQPDEAYDVVLQSSIPRAQITFSITPKYKRLQKLKLTVTVAPSLERCYIFEIVTRHPRTNWESFEDQGNIVVRRWYKPVWTDSTKWIAEKIATTFQETLNQYLENEAKSLRDKLQPKQD